MYIYKKFIFYSYFSNKLNKINIIYFKLKFFEYKINIININILNVNRYERSYIFHCN